MKAAFLSFTILFSIACSSVQTKSKQLKTEIKEVIIQDEPTRLISVKNFNLYGKPYQELFYNKNQQLQSIWTYQYTPDNLIQYCYRYQVNRRSFQRDTFIYKNKNLTSTHTLGPFRTNDKETHSFFFENKRMDYQIDITHHGNFKTIYKIQYQYDNDSNLIAKNRYELKEEMKDEMLFESEPCDYWNYQINHIDNKKHIIAKSYLEDSLIQTLQYLDSLDEENKLISRIFLDSNNKIVTRSKTY